MLSQTSLKALFSVNTLWPMPSKKKQVSSPSPSVLPTLEIIISTKDRNLAEDRHLHTEPNKVITMVEKNVLKDCLENS